MADTQMESLLKAGGAAAAALLFAKSASLRGQWSWAIAVATGGIVYAKVEEARKVQLAANYAATPGAPAPTSGLSGPRRRWKV